MSNNEKKLKKYVPLSKRQDKPDSALWLIKNHLNFKRLSNCKISWYYKKFCCSIRNKSYWNFNNLNAKGSCCYKFIYTKRFN